MSFLSAYIIEIRDWLDDQDPSDAVITSWIRDAEQRLNDELRVTEMVVRGQATFDDDCSLMPPDWLETLYVRLKGGTPFHFISNDGYWQLGDAAPVPNTSGEVYPWPGKSKHYTMIGSTMFVWPRIDPLALTQIEVAYFRKIIPLGDVKDPVLDRYPSVYRFCTLAAGAPYLVEDERLPTWASGATAGIQKANEAAKKARFSGSPISPRIRGFG